MDLVDRQISIEEMEDSWRSAANRGCMLLVYGEAGIGKTALVEQFTGKHQAHARTLWGACDDLFTPRPFGPLHDMVIGRTSTTLSHLLYEQSDRARLFSGFLAELQARPTIAVIEDIHWADEATIDLLKYVGRRIHQTQSLVILTYRNDELSSQHPLRFLLGDLTNSQAVRRIALHPLTIEGVRLLIGERPIDAETLHGKTGGNPFYLIEALAMNGEGIPLTVRDAVLARLARLTLSGRAVLNAAAVIGTRVNPWLLAELTRAEASAVDESLDLGILIAQEEMLLFRHELVRQAILDAIAPHQLIRLHQDVLDALKSSPVGRKDVTRLAHHAEAAGDREAILTYARAAGQEAVALGMQRAAAQQFALALRYADDLPPLEEIELQEAYALCMQSCMQGEPNKSTAISARRRAAELARQAGLPKREGYNLAVLSTLLDMRDEVDESERVLNKALSILEPMAPNRGLVDAYKNLAYKYLKQGVIEAAISYAEKSYQMAQWTEKVHVIISSKQILGLCLLTVDHELGCTHLREALALALEHQDYWTAGSIYPNLTMIWTEVGNLAHAEELAIEGIEFTTEHDMDIAFQVLQGWQSMIHFYRGRWSEAETLAAQLLNQVHVHPYALNPVRIASGRLRARRGLPGAEEFLEDALAGLLKTNNRQRLATAYTARAEVAWMAGDLERVRVEADAVFDVAVENRQPAFAAELAYWRWRAGAKTETHDWMLLPFVLEIQGKWAEAASTWQIMGYPYEQARALAEGDANAQLTALAIFEQLEARPMVEQMRRKLRESGVHSIPRGPRSTTKGNAFGLTNRQVEILLLLTENLSNTEIATRLYISPKTVDHHVSAVLSKLYVSSREEAVALAQQHPNFHIPK